MADLKPVYLVCGEDDVKIDAWRARVKARAEQDGGPGALEAHDASSMGPAELAADLSALTFSTGTRYLLVDGVESWKAGALEPLEAALGDMPPDTVLVLIARGKSTAKLANAVGEAGGETRTYEAPKARELWKWAAERAMEQGLAHDGEAARALVTVVGSSQQRIAREVERLALFAHPDGKLTAEQVTEYAAGDTSPQTYELADAVVAGNVRAAVAIAERLSEAGETPHRLLYAVVRRLRDVHRAAELLDAGAREKDIAERLGMPPWLAKRIVSSARSAGREVLADAICVLADLEVELRGGGVDRVGYSLDEDTALSVALVKASGGVQRTAAAAA